MRSWREPGEEHREDPAGAPSSSSVDARPLGGGGGLAYWAGRPENAGIPNALVLPDLR